MTPASQLKDDQRISIVFRVEPGSLGPEGSEHAEEFCRYATGEFHTLNKDFANWIIIPRYNKQLPELEYRINQKSLPPVKARQYLALFKQDIAKFEEEVEERIAELVEEFFER